MLKKKLRTSIKNEFHIMKMKNQQQILFILEQVENMIHEKIDKFMLQCHTKQQE
jgi:hypothetical protein